MATSLPGRSTGRATRDQRAHAIVVRTDRPSHLGRALSTPEQPDADRPGTSPEQPSVVPPPAPPAGAPAAPPAGVPAAPPVAPPSGWGEPPRYGQHAPAPPQGTEPGAGQGAPTPPGYGAPGYGAPGYGAPGYGAPGYGAPGAQPGYGSQPGYGAPTPYGMPAASPWRPPSDKPGIIPLRPLTLGEIYDGAFSAVRHNPKVMLGLATLVILGATLIGTLVGYLITPLVTSWIGPVFDDPALADAGIELGFTGGDIAQLYATTLGAGLAFLLAGPVVNGLLTVSVSRSVLGDRASVRQVWDRVGPRVWLLIGWSVLQTVALVLAVALYLTLGVLAVVLLADVSGGLAAFVGVALVLLGIAAAIWLSTRLLLVPPALALENAGLFATVRRAWVLTRGSFWRVFGINLLASVIVGVISQVVAVPISLIGSLGALSGGGATGALTITTILTTVVGTAITTIFLAGVVALLYIDLRMRREGLDVTLTAAAERQG